MKLRWEWVGGFRENWRKECVMATGYVCVCIYKIFKDSVEVFDFFFLKNESK